jgi:hypothetical protein
MPILLLVAEYMNKDQRKSWIDESSRAGSDSAKKAYGLFWL